MSFFSNIFGTTSAAAGAPAPVAATAVTPTTVTTPQEPATPVSPLDQFKSIWEPAPASQGVDGTLPGNIFAGASLDKMIEASRNVDFAKSIPPEMLAKITSGGADAATALQAVLNDMNQRAYAQSSFAATQIVERALAKFNEGLDTRLPSQIKKHQVSQTIRESNPALNHPAAAPIMEALQAQMAVKFPNASVNEIRDMAGQYLTAFNTAATPPPKPSATKNSENWDNFFN